MEDVHSQRNEGAPAEDTSELLTTDKVATLLGRSIDAIHTMCQRNQIGHYKYCGRLYFKRSEVEATVFSKANRVETALERNRRLRNEVVADQARR